MGGPGVSACRYGKNKKVAIGKFSTFLTPVQASSTKICESEIFSFWN